jgi:TolA-binding protein
LLLFSCENPESEHRKFNYQLDSLSFVLNSRDSTINDLLSTFNEIERNLDSVTARQGLVSMRVGNTDLKKNHREEISADIRAINHIIEQNQLQIAELNGKLSASNTKITEFEKMINRLNHQIMLKNIESQALNERLNSLSLQVIQLQSSLDNMTASYHLQAETIATQTATMHTAYYVVGTSEELSERSVIDKSGGLLGIGKTSRLNPNFNNTHFIRIDYTVNNLIPINGKGAEIVTSHPRSSYFFDKEGSTFKALRITHPEQFWSASKYLVILKK